ncbi:DNA-binding MarR family transcriptional regulator [Panacagrimonas perspica]|uniref:DNA-binding MarR family transcriptional regulator n=2 Tax=Panacagrimonas perspica TaxID=381431 RepID=A0A4R7PAX7_9GAMM|nr:DNA-binding MarR family transcriptional regulator [Panacagrimonas perspica]
MSATKKNVKREPAVKPAAAQQEIAHVPRAQAARALLDLFYPVHYAVGMKVEDTLRSSAALDRQQAIILWLVRSEGEGGEVMRRKYIEATMTSWYDITGSSISKAIRSLAKPPLRLLTIEEHPDSAREKLIRLTEKGKRFIAQMEENGTALCTWFLGEFSNRDVDYCLYIYSKVNALFDYLSDQRDADSSGAKAERVDKPVSKTTYQHPLSSTFVETQYSFAEIPKVRPKLGPRMQLDIFFPIHYKAGNRVEGVLRSGIPLSRQQVIILWIIQSEGSKENGMRRKDVEKDLQDWFEISSSSISKAIRSLTRPPLNLLTIEEHPSSGREKLVKLSRKGAIFADRMMANGTQFLEGIVEKLNDDEIDMLMHVFKRTSEIFETYPGPFRSAKPVLRPQL